MFWKFTLAVAVLAGLAGALYLSTSVSKAQVKHALKSLSNSAWASGVGHSSPETPDPATPPTDAPEAGPRSHWDGLVEVDAKKQSAIGLHLAAVQAQTQPLKLELSGRTAYDPNTLTEVRPRFDTLVVSVHASLGQPVQKGDPLVELYSTELAQAKSDFQTKYVQWQHDKKLYDLHKNLVQTGAISQRVWVDTQNDEQKSRLEYNLALDKLQVYDVPKEQIDPLIERVKDRAPEAIHFGEISEKAKMTLRARSDGIVIEREVVPGNYYETSNVLMVIAPLDHLWVWVNVYELDQDKVALGQTMEIQFPFLAQKIQGKVQYVANEVSKDTRAVKVRATIPNPGGRLKSDMLLKAILDIPPLPGQTVIPRISMVAINGEEFVFVHKKDASREGHDKFERRKIHVAQETTDSVVVSDGLEPSEEIVTNGSLILAQLYEDAANVETGLPTN
jgi:cobalt-zinc-cadmium efflux system membrane fusion protein